MNSYKLGLHTLGKYTLLSIACWSVAELLPEIYTSAIFITISIVSIIVWYESIKQGLTKSIKDGIIVSMFFIIPYGLIALNAYEALFRNVLLHSLRDELRDALKSGIWKIFSNPMRIINAEMSHMKSVDFFVYEPFIIIGVLLLINIISHLLKRKNENI
jgi:hypothetical protein